MTNSELVETLDKKVESGELNKTNERHSFNIGVLDGNQNYSCTIIVDSYRDLQENELYKVEHHIDKSQGYHTIDITDFENGFF